MLLGVGEFGERAARVAKKLTVSHTAVSMSMRRGERIVKEVDVAL